MQAPVLLKIEVLTRRPVFQKISKKYWKLLSSYHARLHTDQGVYGLKLYPGWITDKRSGSNAINWLVPKSGNEEYNACIFAHDTSYSGFISKTLSDHLFIRQGFQLSGQVNGFVAGLAYNTVKVLGKAYEMDELMPEPYTCNRVFERLYLQPK